MTIPHAPALDAEDDRPPRVSLYLLLGLVQGMALWALVEAKVNSVWPATFLPLWGAAWYAVLAAPLAWYLLHEGVRNRRMRVLWALAISGFCACLGAHLGTTLGAAGLESSIASYLLAITCVGFAVVALVMGFDPVQKRWVYSRLFEFAWRNAILVALAGALTGVFWMLLWAAAWLMESIGLDWLRHVLNKEAFSIPASAAAFGLATGLILTYSDTLKVLRRFWLSLNMWFLPLTLGFALLWMVALLFTGVEPLFKTRNAAFYLLWFGVLAIVFVNAAFQDGAQPPAYPRWLSRALTWAWLTMPLLTLLADWALWQRVTQHGWTPDRIWAAVVACWVTLHAWGYAASLCWRSEWMRSIPAVNIAGTLFKVIVVTALMSPVADVRRLAVNDQMARWQAGKISFDKLDLKFLKREGGAYGEAALKTIAALEGKDEASRLLAQRANETLQTKECPPHCGTPQDQAAAVAALREHMRVLPQGAVLDESLVQWLTRPKAGWEEINCVRNPSNCAVWWVDLNGDGQLEAVLVRENNQRVDATVFKRDASSTWSRQGMLNSSLTLNQWADAVNQERVDQVPAEWSDLMLDGVRLKIR